MPDNNISNQQAADQIVALMVSQEKISAEEIQEITGLSTKESEELAKAVGDDGLIDSTEFGRLTFHDISGRTVKIASLIGDRPQKLYRAARSIQDARAVSRCNAAALGTEAKKPEECIYTLESQTPLESRITNDGVNTIQSMADQGDDVMPALKVIFRRQHLDTSALVALSEIDYSNFTVTEKRYVAGKIRDIFKHTSLDPIKAQYLVRTLKKLGTEAHFVISEIRDRAASLMKSDDNWKTYLRPEANKVMEELETFAVK